MLSIQKQIEDALRHHTRKGQFFFPNDFKSIGTEAAIKMAFGRLTKEGKLQRIAHGLYIRPNDYTESGKIYPSMEEIAEAIAKKEKIRIKATGALALYNLGLTTQLPSELVYLTNGSRKRIKTHNGTIIFKPSTPKKLAMRGKKSALIIQLLEEINPAKIDDVMKAKFKELMAKENIVTRHHNLRLAPARTSDYLLKLRKSKK